MAAHKFLQVDHITVRLSISFLILRLLLIQVLFGVIFFFLAYPDSFIDSFFSSLALPELKIYVFVGVLIINVFFMAIVVYQWLNEYYEITPTQVIHKQGFIFRKEEAQGLDDTVRIGLYQDLLGKILNYGTIHLVERFTEREHFIYLIHNPVKYYHIIKNLIPHVDEEKETVGPGIVKK